MKGESIVSGFELVQQPRPHSGREGARPSCLLSVLFSLGPWGTAGTVLRALNLGLFLIFQLGRYFLRT